VLIWQYFSWRIMTLRKIQKETLEKEAINKQLIASQLENLRSQMNPHFIFNALNSIQDYIIQNEQSLARRFLVKFSELIRMYLEHSQVDTITVSEEMEALKLYLELEKERFEDNFLYKITTQDNLANSTLKIPTFLIQPYIENAIIHGLMHKEDNQELLVNFKINEVENSLICTVTDNGVGRKASEEINNNRLFKHKSFSTSANIKRIDLLNKSNTNPVAITITDNYTDNKAIGTTVRIKIPIKNTLS